MTFEGILFTLNPLEVDRFQGTFKVLKGGESHDAAEGYGLGGTQDMLL
jgi:hypothetical protein